MRDALEVAYDHVRESLCRTAARRKRLYDTKAVNRKFPIGSCVLRYYPLAAEHKLGSPWIGPNQVVRQTTGHTVGIQRDPQKPIVFVHVDNLKLCPAPEDVKRSPNISTDKSPGSHVSDVTSAPSADVSDWEDVASHHSSQAVIGELDRPIDLTGHVLSPFFIRNMDYMDSIFHSIAHMMCYRYAIANGQRTFATGIRKWSKHLVDFPTPKFVTSDSIQQWRGILMDIYNHLCLTDESLKTNLIANGPRPFRLQCANLISDILIEVRVCAASNTFTPSGWLGLKQFRPGTRGAVCSLCFTLPVTAGR